MPGERAATDLLVAGGGPAGLATAIQAAALGMSVRVLEPRTGPIDKACGEGLMPGAVRALRTLGVEPDGLPFRGIGYIDGPVRAEARFTRGAGLGVRRTTLHAAMTARALELGVLLERGSATDLRQDADGVELAGWRARHLVAADGLHSPLRRALGLDARRPSRRPVRYGLVRHYRTSPWTDLVEVHWAARREAYVTPVSEDVVGVALLGPRGARFDDALEEFPELLAALRGGERVGPDLGAGPLRRGSRARVAGRVLLVGDASGYVDALTGEGIRVAIDEGAAAVAAIADEDPDSYETAWRAATAGYRRGTNTLLAVAARPVLRHRLVPTAARWPTVFTRLVDGLAQ